MKQTQNTSADTTPEIEVTQTDAALPHRLSDLMDSSQEKTAKEETKDVSHAEDTPVKENVETEEVSSPKNLSDLLQSSQQSAEEQNKVSAHITPQPKDIAHHSAAHRFLHAVLAMVILSSTFFLSSLFSGEESASSAEGLYHLQVQKGTVILQDAFTSEQQQVSSEMMFAHESVLQTEDDTTATIDLGNAGQVRVGANTVLTIGHSENIPTLQIEQGDVWLFALRNVHVSSGSYTFALRDGSARLQLTEAGIIASAWDNALDVTIHDTNSERHIAFAVPFMSRAVFPTNTQQDARFSTLAQLRFSKLLKEFQITSVQPAKDDRSELVRDRVIRDKYARTMVQTGELAPGLLELVQQYTTWMPAQRDAFAQHRWQQKQSAFLNGNQQRITSESISADQLQTFLSDVLIMEESLSDKSIRHQVEDMIGAQSAADAPQDFEITLIANAFHGLQKALRDDNTDWRDQELKRIQVKWENAAGVENETAVIAHRSNLLRLAQTYPSVVDDTFIAFLAELDDLQIQMAAAGERTTTQLEVIYQHLNLANAFVAAQNLDLARDILNRATQQFASIDGNVDPILQRKIADQKQAIEVRLAACDDNQACSKEDFRTWLAKKEILACEVSQACTRQAFEQWLQNFITTGEVLRAAAPEETDDAENFTSELFTYQTVEEILAEAEITLETGKKTSDTLFTITRAITKNGFPFGATMSLDPIYLQDITLPEDKEIAGPLTLDSLENAIYLTVAPSSDNNGSNSEADSVSPLDPELAELIVRKLQQPLLDNNIITLQEDITLLSATQAQISTAVVDPQGANVVIRFDLILDPETNIFTLTNIIATEPEQFTLAAVELSAAAEAILAAAGASSQQQALVEEALKVFAQKSFTIAPENVQPVADAEQITFEKLQDVTYDLAFFGRFNPFTQRFVSVENDQQQIQPQADIHIDEYRQMIEAANTPPEEVIAEMTDEEKAAAEAALEEEENTES